MLEHASYRVGIVGCGNILSAYVRGLRRFPYLEMIRCADVIAERAKHAHEEYGIPRFGGIGELLSDDDVDIVLNITPPDGHMAVLSSALNAGKHAYTEKPLVTHLGDADALIALARRLNLVLGCAPDTFLGSWGATSRSVIDHGIIGEVIAASAVVPHNRVETWHPDPTFVFRRGGGPALDRGPYFICALINLLGPVADVIGMTRIGQRRRVVSSPGRHVDVIDAEVATHVTGALRFASGPIATVIFSSDIWATETPSIEIYGTEGTMSLPHPNWFDGEVRVKSRDAESGWSVIAPVGPEGGLRGEGVADVVGSLEGRPLRVGAELARHVLEVLQGLEQSSTEGTVISIQRTCDRPVWPELPEPQLARSSSRS